MATPRMLNGARVNLMPKCVYQGSMKITAIEKRKLSSKREDILDNTEPCQTKYGAASVVVDEQSWLSSGVEKSPY